MSKTFLIQVEKARLLIDGLRKNYDAVHDKGIDHEGIDRMEQFSREAEALNGEVEALREATSRKVREANAKLEKMKNLFTDYKKTIKTSFLPDRWADFGVMDKR